MDETSLAQVYSLLLKLNYPETKTKQLATGSNKQTIVSPFPPSLSLAQQLACPSLYLFLRAVFLKCIPLMVFSSGTCWWTRRSRQTGCGTRALDRSGMYARSSGPLTNSSAVNLCRGRSPRSTRGWVYNLWVIMRLTVVARRVLYRVSRNSCAIFRK